jgi:hypothetical protein
MVRHTEVCSEYCPYVQTPYRDQTPDTKQTYAILHGHIEYLRSYQCSIGVGFNPEIVARAVAAGHFAIFYKNFPDKMQFTSVMLAAAISFGDYDMGQDYICINYSVKYFCTS